MGLYSFFQQLQRIVCNLKVINNPAERCVKFESDFTDVITKDETMRQNILQQVEAVRRAYLTSSKNFFRLTKNI